MVVTLLPQVLLPMKLDTPSSTLAATFRYKLSVLVPAAQFGSALGLWLIIASLFLVAPARLAV